VDGPYSVLLSADVYTKVGETAEHGYPIREHLNWMVDGDIIWRPRSTVRSCCPPAEAISICIWGTDVSIGYLSHDAATVELYLQGR
jgi:uncharacterized linocin/CFP29 family protein